MKNKLNIIQQIRKAINGHNVKLEFFQEEFCVSLYDSEIPIIVVLKIFLYFCISKWESAVRLAPFKSSRA